MSAPAPSTRPQDAVAEATPPAPQPFLATPVAEALSLALFAGGAVAFTEALPFLPPHRAILAVGATLLGLIGAGIERGEARRLGWGGALGLAALAAGLHLGLLALARGAAPGVGEVLARGLPVLLLGASLARFAARFDRGEAGWRAAARSGPRRGASALGDALATRPLPAPLRVLGWVLLPVDLALRAASLAAILGYQLSFSRLMPPACRYEPSCSRYGFEAYRCHGFLRASALTAWRLVRCSPLGSGGYDPMVPPPRRATGPAEGSGTKGAEC